MRASYSLNNLQNRLEAQRKSPEKFVLRTARFAVRWPAVFGHPRAGDTPGKVVNVGATGLLFISPATYTPGDMVESDIYCSDIYSAQDDSEGVPVRCILRIMRERPAPEGLQAYGARIYHILPESAQILTSALLRIYKQEVGQHTRAAAGTSPLRFFRLRR
ncbi:MAG TPA: hypothetical protein VGS41_08890 [Chthonomonadales bacterium]|nr:hypothetical protein [Chthonomonadales bacterium]